MKRLNRQRKFYENLILSLFTVIYSFYFVKAGEPVAQSSPVNYTNNSYLNGNGTYGSSLDRNNTTTESETNDDRGRDRKKRDFFGTLKRRLGRSKSRTKSLERGMVPIDADNPNGELRSVSMDRMTSGTLGNSIGGGLTSNRSTGNYSCAAIFILFWFFLLSFHLKIEMPSSHSVVSAIHLGSCFIWSTDFHDLPNFIV